MKSIIERRLGAFSFFVAFVFTFIAELALVERKYSIFGGGFGQSLTLNSIGDLAVFFGVVVLCHVLMLSLFYWTIIRLHPKNRSDRFVHYNFVFFTVALVGVALAVKYKVLSYFSDAISFQLIKSLGGGSLIDALLYVADEASIIVTVMVAMVALYWIGMRILAVRRQSVSAASGKALSARNWFFAIAVVFTVVPAILYALHDSRNIRYALDRFYAFNLINRALSRLTDFDGDGYSYFTMLTDPYPFDASRYPLALDLPGNGVDEDGFAGDFVYEPIPEPPMPRIQGAKKNLVLIVLESTRADVIGKTINGMTVSPNLNELARTGSSIRDAYSHVGFTSPSLKSLFSGTLHATGKSRSLFRDLKANGYGISVFSGQPETFGGISQTVGMQANCDVFVDAETLKEERAFAFAAKGSLLVDGQILLREFDRHLGSSKQWERPNFIYFNFQSAHFPYYHRGMKSIIENNPIPRDQISKKNSEWVKRTYWNAVSYADWLVGQVIARLKKLGVYENTLLVVTADHGESLFDDGFLGHGHMINTQQTKIPLVVNRPGFDVPHPVGLSDYYRLVMKLLGADGPYQEPIRSANETGVFQFIGVMDTPSSIGLVEQGEKWTIMDFDTQVVSFPDLNRSVDYRDLKNYPALKERSDRLIREWERQRWEKHLAERVSPALN